MDKTEMLNSLLGLAQNDLRSAEYLSTMTNPTRKVPVTSEGLI